MSRSDETTFACQLLGDVAVVRVRGELDWGNVEHLCDTLSFATTIASRAVVVDFSELTFLDCAVSRALVEARAEAFRAGLPLSVASPSRAAARLLLVTGASREVPVYDTVSQAIAGERVALRHVPGTPLPATPAGRRPGDAASTDLRERSRRRAEPAPGGVTPRNASGEGA